MDMQFTEEQLLLQKAFRDYAVKKVAPNAARWDEENICPVELFPELGKMGILGCFAPREYGGLDLGHVERIMAIEEISRYSAGLGMFIFTHQLALGAFLDFGSREHKEQYLPDMCKGNTIWGLAVTEPGGGTDLMNHKTVARKEGDEWVINGRKCFITNHSVADYVLITAKTGEDKRGRNQLSTFIVPTDTPGFKVGREENKLGMKGSVTGDLLLNDVRVPEENLFSELGNAAKVALKEIGEIGRASMSAICVGLMKGCLEDSLKFSNDRIIYGKPLNEIQAIQFHIAEIRTTYELGRLMIYKAATLKDSGVPSTAWNGMAKLHCVNGAVDSARRAVELMGGYGIITEYSVGRFMREALAAISAGGTNEVQKMVIYNDTAKTFL
jgi:alkylation response protein AidB-like acyl-CoA dehydrogenase